MILLLASLFGAITPATSSAPLQIYQNDKCGETGGKGAVTLSGPITTIMWDTLAELTDLSVSKKSGTPWELYMPCSHGKTQSSDESMLWRQYGCARGTSFGLKPRMFALTAIGAFTFKDQLWRSLKAHLGFEGASGVMPATYMLADRGDVVQLKRHHKEGTSYFIKNPLKHQQKGISTADTLAQINEAAAKTTKGDRRVLAQVALLNPFMIEKHKINLRTYILVTCEGKGGMEHPTEARQRWFMHNDAGKVYYSAEPYVRGGTNKQTVTSSYGVPRSFCESSGIPTHTHNSFACIPRS
jgi:hypothetical protein